MPEIESPPTTTHHDDRTELEKLLLKSRPWLQENATTLIYALAAVLAIAAIVIYAGRMPTGNAEASRALLLAVTPEDFRDVADEFPETDIGAWSRLRQGDRLLDNAVSNLFSNRAVGLEELDQAEAAYQRLADRSSLDEEIRERVLIGLARVTENRNDGTEAAASKAVAAWQRVLDEFPTTIVKDHAEARVAELTTERSQQFYAWFHKLDPKPDSPALGPGQTDVPAVPEGLTIPGLGGAAASDGPVEATVPAEKPDAADDGDKKSAPAETNAPESPADAKADATDAPKEEKPATTPPPPETPQTNETKPDETKADEAKPDEAQAAPEAGEPTAEKDGK